MVEKRLIALLLSGVFLMSVLPFSPSVSFDPLQMGDDDEGQALSEQQIEALESLPASVKVSGRTGNSTVETVQWAVKAGSSYSGGYSSGGGGIAVDSSGNAFVTGSFYQTVTFGSTTLTSSGKDDIFVAKISSSGSWQWATKADGSHREDGRRIAVDSSGNAYVFGLFTNNATFGSTTLEQDFVYSSEGYTHYDHFVAKFLATDADGDGVQNPLDNCVYDANADQAAVSYTHLTLPTILRV